MDIKITGVTREIMGQALAQARAGRLHILDQMEKVLAQPRTDISRFAPRLYTLVIPKEKIRDVIGPGGKMIRSIIEETGCDIEIEDDGKVVIASPDEPAARRAIQMIERLTEVPEIGKVYTGQVRRVENYGAFVEIMPGNIDETGRVRLSRKAVIMESPDYDPAQYEGMEMAAVEAGGGGERERERGGRGGDRERGGRGGFRGGRGGGGGRGGNGGGRSRGPGGNR
jgi:polyribonucleotide nucleotidyltransferase